MDEQRAWIRARRKRRLRITAVILAFCLLTTTYPNILETISVFAAGSRGDGGTMSITGFVNLPEETAQQTVPVGTDILELELPGTLEAYVIVEAEDDTEDDRKPDDGDQNKDNDEDDGDSDRNEGDQENSDEGADETGDGETGDANGNDADSEEEPDEVASAFGIQTDSFVMPIYMSENQQDALTVETLTVNAEENAARENKKAEDTIAQNTTTETITIENITWKSSPAYDGDVEGVYTFTPVLPEGYALADGVSLPEITVTVVADDTQAEELRALMELLRALPDPEEYLTYDEAEDIITEHEEIIDEEQLAEAREAADDYLDKYPDADTDTDSGADSYNTKSGTASGIYTLPALLTRLEGLEHIRDTVADCMDFDCPYHYPQFVQSRMEQDEVPELLTLEDLIEDYGVEEPTAPAAQTYSSRARAAGTYAASAYAATTLHPQTLMLTDDNENNAHTGTADGDIDVYLASHTLFGGSVAAYPIEISFTLNELPTQSAYLAVKAYDVDEEKGEIDRVYLNDDIYTLTNAVGNLAGTNNAWNTTILEIPLDRLQKGKNVISITISDGWSVEVDWMQLVLDGGAADSNIEEFSLKIKDAATEGRYVTVHSDVTIKQKGSTKYVTEYTLTQMSTGNALDACFGSAAATETVGLTMPLDSPTGFYKITGILKDPNTEQIKAVDKITFYFTQGAGMGPKTSHTLTPDTLTNQNVTIRVSVQDVPEAGISGAVVSPASRTVQTNGTYDFTVSYKMGSSTHSFTYPVKVDNIDKTAPVIAYTPVTVEEDTAYAEVKALFDEALSATDDRKLAEEPLTYTLPTNITSTYGTKSITVTAADLAGNKATKVCQITVTAKPISLTMGDLKAVTGSKDSYVLKAVLDHTGAGTITETGFVWGVMQSPTLDVKNGTVKTSTVIKTKGGTFSANATGLSSGVVYYGRAYAKVADAAGKASVVYSESKMFGFDIPKYGTFSVSGVSGSTFTITRTGGTDGKQTVYYRTVNGSAIGGTHFTHLASSVTFADGESSKTVTVTEKGVTTAYGGSTATSYSNADRTYSFEIYRVDGGAQINQSSRIKTRTMTKSSSYTVDRTVYTTEKSKTNVSDYTGQNGKKITDTTSGQGGKKTNVSFLTNRDKTTNYNTNSSFSTYYTDASQRTYLNATAGGWYYRYDLQAYEHVDGYEHVYFGRKALEDKHYGLSSESAAVSGVDGQLWACNFLQPCQKAKQHYYFPDTRTGGGEGSGYPKNSSGTTASYNSKTYVDLGLNDTCYIYFGATGADTDTWYVDGLVSYAIVYDKVEPKCIGVAPMAGGTYLPGDAITVSLVFDEIVDKTNSGDLSKVAISTNVGTLTYAGGADTNVLYFTGTVSSSVNLSGSSALKVTGITNNSSIKDMCNLAGTTSSFTSRNTNVDVDATKPTVTITPKTSGTLPRHQAAVTATGAASVQYAWTKTTDLPAYGWQTTTSGATLTESCGTAGATETWYLHVLATASTGASTHVYQSFSFRQPAITAVSVRETSSATSADVADVWKPYKYIVVQYAGTQTSGTTLAFDGPKTSSQSITASSGTKYLQVTQNGAYTVTLKDGCGNVISQNVEVKKIDTAKPTVTLRSGSSTGTDAIYNDLTVAVFPEDTGGSGVAKVEYAWTNTTSSPSSWSTLTAAADGSYQAKYTATETAKTAKYLHVRVTDGAGNVSTVVRSGPYQMLRKATTAELPAITVTGKPTAWTKSADLKWTVKAGSGTVAGTITGVYTPDSNTPKTGTTGISTVTKNGNYMFTVMDSNGNSATAEVNVTRVDNEAPKLTGITATGGKTGTITLTGVTDDCTVILDAKGNYSSTSGSGIATRQYQMAGASSWTTFTGSSFTVYKNGTYTVRLTDKLGNVGEYSVDMTDIDATAPKVTCTVNATPNANSGWYTASTVPVILTFADEAGAEGGTPSGIQSVQYARVTDNTTKPTSGLSSLGTSAITGGTYTYNITSSYNGSYYLYYKVTDKKGNVTEGFSDLIQKDSYTGGSGGITGPSTGQPVSTGLAMNIKFYYGPAGGYLTGGTTAASAERITTMSQHATGTQSVDAAYTAKTTGTNYFRYYRYAVNGATGSSYSSWSFYVRQVDFNTQGGSNVGSQLIWTTQSSSSTSTAVQCKVFEPTAPTRTGYTFGGWYTDAACTAGKEFDFNTQVRTNITLYAKWTANTYNVTYHLTNSDGNAYMPETSVKTYTYGQGLTLPVPISEKAGFTFYGWYDNAGYTGTAYTSIAKTATGDKAYYAYFKDMQAPQITGTELVNTTDENAEGGWYRSGSESGSAAVAVTGCSDNDAVQSVSILVDDQPYTETGISMPSAGTYQYALQEGEHSYTFKLTDAAGNETVSEKKTVKYDGTKPVIGEITYEKKVFGFLDWIIGKESLIIHIPVEDGVSGVKSLTYQETVITGTEEVTETKTVSLSGKTGEQTVDLKLDADWKGRISDIVCTDRAGNASDSKTVGTNGGIIVEDNAPVITIVEADMTDASDPRPGDAVSGDYYEENAAPTLYVSVQDENADGDGISAGIKSITYTVGGGAEQTVTKDFTAQLSDHYAFIIPLTGYAGVVNVTVKAADYAGNTAQTNVNVKIRGKESAPNAKPAYLKDALANLTPGAVYEITVPAGDGGTNFTCIADGQGEIPLILPISGESTIDLCGETIAIVKKGDGTNTTDSDAQILAIAARPPAPTGTVTPELAEGMDDAVINVTVDEQYQGKKEYSTDNGATWSDVPNDDIIKDLAPGNVLIRMKATETAPRGLTGQIPVSQSANKIRVVFALNYEGAGAAHQVQENKKGKDALTKPADPTRSGFDFTGWYKSDSCGEQDKWRFEDSEDGTKNLVRDIVDKTQEDYKNRYNVENGMITVTLYAGWRENVAPNLNAVLTDGSNAADGSNEKDQTKWHTKLSISLTYFDNVAVTKLYVRKDSGEYKELAADSAEQITDSTDGYAQYRLTFNDIVEGEHTYAFKAEDAAGNESQQVTVTAKLDTKRPELGEASFNEGYKNLWDWIIRKDSLIITIPVTETGSGIDTVTYELIPTDGGTGEASEATKGTADAKKTSGSNESKTSDYTATISIAPEFKGQVKIVAKDKAGNASLEKTIGADGNGIAGVIIEDNAPGITILADRGVNDEAATQAYGTALSDGAYYDTAPKLIVKVEDEETSEGKAVTAGLLSITWKIGSGAWNSVNADFVSNSKTSHSFVINELEGQTGVFSITVKAVDQAGNETEMSVTVRVKEREPVPKPTIDYINEKLTGLVPGASYGVEDEIITADVQGCIDIQEEWFGSSIQMYTKGKEGLTLDSENAQVALAARPEAPNVSKKSDETIKGKSDGVLTGADATMEYSTDGGREWENVKSGDIVNGDMTGLPVGEILIRVRATTTAPRGEHAEVEIGEGRTLTVTFETNGGSSLASVTGKSWNDTLACPEAPVKEGYALVDWYKEAGLNNIWNFEEKVNADRLNGENGITADNPAITLYAKWQDSAKPNLSALLADDKSGGNWYRELGFIITYSDNVGTKKLYVKRDNGDYTELSTSGSAENGKDSDQNTRYQLIYSDLAEGEHTYTFKAVDEAGNVTETEPMTAKLDTTKPVLGEASFEEGYKNVWNWIIRKDSLIITIPVTETESGIEAVEYTLVPTDGQAAGDTNGNTDSGLSGMTGKAEVKKASGSEGSASPDYTATICIVPDFKGTITIAALDKAGNRSGTKTIGTDGGGIKGVIVEDNAPIITILADRFETDETGTQVNGVEISESYYKSAPELLVKIADDVVDDSQGIVSGIASVSWKIDGEEHAVDENFDVSMQSDYSFKITDLAGKSGQRTVIVAAVDQAGNIAEKTVIVRIIGKEEKPDPKIDYENERLIGLKPNTDYVIQETYVTTDNNGEIQIPEYWIETTISIYQPGDNVATIDSDTAEVAIPGRVDTPDAKIDYRQEKLTGLEANAQYLIDGVMITTDSYGSLVIKEEQMNGENYEIVRERVEGKFRSKSQTLEIPTRPAAPEGVTGVKASRKAAANGKLKGIDDTMEYREIGSEQWIEITSELIEMHAGNGNTKEDDEEEVVERTIGGLAVGEYLVRYQATDYAFAGNASQVKIAWKKAQSKPGNGEKDPDSGDENPPADGDEPTDGNPPTGSNPPGGEEIQVMPVIIEDGNIIISGEPGAIAESAPIKTGNVNGMTAVSTILQIDNGNGSAAGAVIVTVLCEEQAYTAGVADTVAVANAVLTPEQLQLVKAGETIEIRIEVKDISGSVPKQDQEIIEGGIEAYQNEIPGLKLGMYIDISMFVRVGEGAWNAVTATKEPVEVIIGIPEELRSEGREYYIIRAHDGEYTLMNDADDTPDTITISTGLFSSYAIAYQQTDEAKQSHKCGLCHICPTFLSVCCFIWLAVIAAVIIVVVIVILRRKKETDKA